MNNQLTQAEGYQVLVTVISDTYVGGYEQAARAVNSEIIATYWDIGRHIVEYEQGGSTKAAYGTTLLENLARDLSLMHGRGFSRSNLYNMRLFYQRYPIFQKASGKLSWSHYVELLKIDDELERSFLCCQ